MIFFYESQIYKTLGVLPSSKDDTTGCDDSFADDHFVDDTTRCDDSSADDHFVDDTA